MTYRPNEIDTYCDGRQEWRITSPQYPGTMHCIESRFVATGDGQQLPSEAVRQYMADVAKKVAEMADWGGSR